MKNTFYPLIALIIFSFSLTSCATLLKGKKEIILETQNKDSELYVNGESVGKGKSIKYTPKSNFEYQVKTPGYEDLHGFLYPTKISPWFHLTVMTVYFIANDPNRFQFLDKYELQDQRKLISRKEGQHYLDFENVAFKVKSSDYQVFTQSLQAYLKNKKPKNYRINGLTRKNDNSIDLEETIFDNELNKFCKKLDFIDTTGAFLSSKFNSLSMEVTVDDIDFLIVRFTKKTSFFETTLRAKWKVVNAIGEEIYSHESRSTSGKFNLYGASDKTEETINTSVVDAFRHAFLDLLDTDDFQELLSKKIEEETIEKMELKKPVTLAKSLEEAVKSCVTVKVDDGHGSGFFINNEGHILTNYHVIKDGKKIEAIIDSKSYPAEVIQSAKFADLAILKVDYKSEFAIEITNERKGELGNEIYAIGTPSSVELPSTISKGIISGYRKSGNQYDLLQTDVSINFGNSGGPLVDSNANLIGIVNSKLAGFGIEGISFGLSNEYILPELNLKFVD